MWGVATAAAQIEGAARADGKGESNWDDFARTPGKLNRGDTPKVACDNYNRFQDDIALMARLDVRPLRLSIARPRIFPTVDGELNPAGLGFLSVDR